MYWDTCWMLNIIYRYNDFLKSGMKIDHWILVNWYDGMNCDHWPCEGGDCLFELKIMRKSSQEGLN